MYLFLYRNIAPGDDRTIHWIVYQDTLMNACVSFGNTYAHKVQTMSYAIYRINDDLSLDLIDNKIV